MTRAMHNPLPPIDYTFRDLPWSRRLRRKLLGLCPIDLTATGLAFDSTMLLSAQYEVDNDLDQAIWEGGHVFARIRSLLNGYGQSNAKKDVVKAAMLSAALNHTFAGHAKSLNNVPKWKVYAARVATVRQANKTELVLFEAESDEMAMDLVLGALLEMEEFKQTRPNHVWNLVALFYKRDQKYHLPPVDVDLTNAFWERASGLVARTA